MVRIIAIFLGVFAVSLAVMPLVIWGCKRLKFRQTVLHYVTEHKQKSGIPTMGGLGFILPLLLVLLFARGDKTLLLVTLAVTVGYAIVGFLDDFIKIFFKRNEGLSAIQKIVFQLAIAIVVSVFAYKSPYVGGSIYSVFGFKEIDLGLFSIPLYVTVFLSLTNAVNLTDGLDGLAGGVTATYVVFFTLFLGLSMFVGVGGSETENLVLFCVALCAALLGFLCFNSFPAKIFMGDTGSLALGGALACLAIFSRRVLIVPLLGIMYLLTVLSVIIQVLHYKRTKTRVFLMAPLHHHFQQKGASESKIGFFYRLVTTLSGLACLLGFLLTNSAYF